MRSLGTAIASGLLKGLVVGALVGAGLSYGLGWSLPAGSLAGYLAAMGAAGTTGVAGGEAPWRDGAWIVATIKMLAGVGIGALLYWLFASYLDVRLPAPIVARLAPSGASLAEDGGLSWIAVPVLVLPAIAAIFGLLVEIDHVGAGEEPSRSRASATRSARSATTARTKSDRARLEQAETSLDERAGSTRRDRARVER